MSPDPDEVAAAFGEAPPPIHPGDIVLTADGERRTVIEVTTQEAAPGERHARDDGTVLVAVLRRCDDDPQRQIDDEGGDIDITAAYVGDLRHA